MSCHPCLPTLSHAVFKHPGPLSAGTEVHLEWCMSYANLSMFLYPFYQVVIFGHDSVLATDMHDHDLLTERGAANLHHVRHHLYATGNFSAPELDAKYGTLLSADGKRLPKGADIKDADLVPGVKALVQKAAMKEAAAASKEAAENQAAVVPLPAAGPARRFGRA